MKLILKGGERDGVGGGKETDRKERKRWQSAINGALFSVVLSAVQFRDYECPL